MKTRKMPMRTCVITQEKCLKKDLVRIVRTPDNDVVIDKEGKQNGHGAYLQLKMEVIEKAKNNKALEKALEIEIPDSIYEELENILKR